MKIVEQFNGESWEAISHELTKDFMLEYLELCKKHRVALVPVDSLGINLHDHLRVVPWADYVQEYIEETDVVVE
jgi:hypothetical protein